VLTREGLLKRVLAFAIGALFLFLLVFTIRFVHRRNSTNSFDFTKASANVQIDHFSLVQAENGTKDWELLAKRARVYDKDAKAVLEGVQVKVFGYQGLGMSFDADKGILDTTTKDLYLERSGEPLKVALNNGYTVYAPSVNWQNTSRKILADGPITIVGTRVRINGKRLIVGADTGDFQVIGDVEAKLQ